MRVSVLGIPAPVVSWEDADAHLRLSGDESQQLEVEAMIAAATAHIDGPDGWLGRALGFQTLEARFDVWESGGALALPCPPIIDLLSIKYLNAAREEITADLADYELIDRRIDGIAGVAPWVGCYVGREVVRVKYRAGYAADPDADPIVSTLPAPIRSAILLMVGDLYRFRETAGAGASSVVPMSTTVEHLLAPFRVYR